jgi:hypothetical protein
MQLLHAVLATLLRDECSAFPEPVERYRIRANVESATVQSID